MVQLYLDWPAIYQSISNNNQINGHFERRYGRAGAGSSARRMDYDSIPGFFGPPPRHSFIFSLLPSHLFLQPWERTASRVRKRRRRPSLRPRCTHSSPLCMTETTHSILRPSLSRRNFLCRPTKALFRTMAITKRPLAKHLKRRTKV